MSHDSNELRTRLSKLFLKESSKPTFVLGSGKDETKEELARGAYTQFWSQYCEHVSTGELADIKQINVEASQLAITVVGQAKPGGLQVLTALIQEYLLNTFVFDRASDNSVDCIITGSEATTTFHFPFIRLNTRELEQTYLPDLYSFLKAKGSAYELSTILPLYPPLYGSDDEQFIIAYSQDCDSGDVELDAQHFDPRHHTKVQHGLIDEELFMKPNVDDWYWLPLILSVDYWYSITQVQKKSGLVKEANEKVPKVYPLDDILRCEPIFHTPHTLDDYMTFIGMWNPERILSQRYWKVIGEAFCTLERGDLRGLNLWVSTINNAKNHVNKANFLSRGNIRKRCEAAYNGFKIGKTTTITLATYARIDNPISYELWHDHWVMDALVKTIPCYSKYVSEVSLSEVFYRLYWLDFVCGDTGMSTIWFKFVDHRLRRDFKGLSLKWVMSNSFMAVYSRMRSDVALQLRGNVVGQDQNNKILEGITRIMEALGRQGFKNKLLDACEEKFRKENITTFIDQNASLTCLLNGVVCASEDDIYFRDGILEDYLTKVAGANYRADYSWDHPIIYEVLQWALVTFVEPDLIEYFWLFLASLLLGGNNDKKLFIWSGVTGGNCKSTWEEGILETMGGYGTKMPINYFTMGKGSANAASPAEAALDGIRIVFSEEPDENVPLLVHIIKSDTGNDSQLVRKLYEDVRKMIPQHKTVIVCNVPPMINKEGASEDRVVIIPFLSQMIYGAPESIKEQFDQRKFPRDPLFNRKLPMFRDAIMWIMFNTYPAYVSKDGKIKIRTPPASVTKMTQEFWDANDRYLHFAKDNIIDEPGERVEVYDVYNRFVTWHTNNHRRIDPPSKEKAVKEFTAKWGEPMDGAWQGKAFKRRAKKED